MAGIPPTNFEYLKKNFSLAGVHKDLMHYMARVRPPFFPFSLFLLLFFFLLGTNLVSFLQTVALITSSIERYKYYDQLRAKNLDCLSKARNENLTLKGEAKAVISGFEKKL